MRDFFSRTVAHLRTHSRSTHTHTHTRTRTRTHTRAHTHTHTHTHTPEASVCTICNFLQQDLLLASPPRGSKPLFYDPPMSSFPTNETCTPFKHICTSAHNKGAMLFVRLVADPGGWIQGRSGGGSISNFAKPRNFTTERIFLHGRQTSGVPAPRALDQQVLQHNGAGNGRIRA